MVEMKNIAGCILCDASAAFLNGAGLASGENKNVVTPKTFKEMVNGRKEEVPYIAAQSWRRWLRNTSNEENNWEPSELHAIDASEKGNTSKIATELNPIDYPEDDLFGYMKSGSSSKKEEKESESIQRTSPFKTSILKGIRNMRTLNIDEAFVHLKEGTPLPYSTKFYSTHMEGFFNLEYYRLGTYVNSATRKELSSELTEKYSSRLIAETIQKNLIKYTLNNAPQLRKERAAGLLKGLVYLRGGAKMAAFGSDVSPKVIIFAGLSSANPIFNNLFLGTGARPMINTSLLKELADDYADKMATPIHIGIRAGYLDNEDEVKALRSDLFIVDSPVNIVKTFISKYLSNE